MADDESYTVFRGELPLVAPRKISDSAGVRVILRDHRVEIVTGHVAGGAQAKRILAPCVLVLGTDTGRVIAAAEDDELPMESGIFVLKSSDLNDAAHLPTKFRRNAGGINREGFDVIGFGSLRAKAGRTVVGERYAVDNKLRLIFRSAWVQNRIAFVKPARL